MIVINVQRPQLPAVRVKSAAADPSTPGPGMINYDEDVGQTVFTQHLPYQYIIICIYIYCIILCYNANIFSQQI